MERIAVIGAGAWGTALANVAAREGHDVVLWAREAEVVESIESERVNAAFLAGVPVDPGIRPTSSMRCWPFRIFRRRRITSAVR